MLRAAAIAGCLASLAGVMPALALDLDTRSIESCLAQADAPASCIGIAAAACIDTPDGYTTVGMGYCYGEERDWWDEQLNASYQALMDYEKTLMTEMKETGATVPDSASALRDMQRAWISYRDAVCGYEASTWGGGTGQGPAHAQCMMQETARQFLILDERLRMVREQ